MSGDLGIGSLQLAYIARGNDRVRVSGLNCCSVEVQPEVVFSLEVLRVSAWARIVARVLGLVARSSR